MTGVRFLTGRSHTGVGNLPSVRKEHHEIFTNFASIRDDEKFAYRIFRKVSALSNSVTDDTIIDTDAALVLNQETDLQMTCCVRMKRE
jgi:hypothetical protein